MIFDLDFIIYSYLDVYGMRMAVSTSDVIRNKFPLANIVLKDVRLTPEVLAKNGGFIYNIPTIYARNNDCVCGIFENKDSADLKMEWFYLDIDKPKKELSQDIPVIDVDELRQKDRDRFVSEYWQRLDVFLNDLSARIQ